jgi:hypothetical protein
MQLVYEYMPQRAAHISVNGYTNEYRYGCGYRHGYGYKYRGLVCIYTGLLASRRSVNQQVLEASKVTKTKSGRLSDWM